MLKFAKFIGANTDFSTAQAFLFPRSLPEEPVEPVFGLVISCEGEDVFVYVRQKILNLEERFSVPFERVTEKLHELGEVLKTEFSGVESLGFTLFCAREGTFYVYQFGKNFVEIYRDGESSSVFADLSLQEKVISGFIKPEDKILILSAKPGEVNWSRDVVDQILTLPASDIDDAESIFASSELKLEQKADFAGIKNIEPVAFILIENRRTGEEGLKIGDSSGAVPKPSINFKLRKFSTGAIKLPSFNFWIFLHKTIRRFFGLLRRTNKKLLVVLAILVLILAIGIGSYVFWQRSSKNQNLRFNNLVASVETSLNETSVYKDSDLKQAQEKLAQAKTRLNEAKSLNKDNSKITELQGRIDEKETEVLRIYKNFNLDLFMSLDLIKSTFKTDRMSFSVGKILMLDENEKSLVAIDTKLKTPNIIAGSQQLGNGTIASLNGSHAFVYAPNKGITHVDIDTKKASSVAPPDPEWGNVTDIFGFASNVYILDIGNPPAGGKIWKYAPTLSGYSDRQEYLKSEANLGLGKKLVIDYSVWVLTSEPDILKFTAGNSDFYAMSGLNEPLTQIDNLFVPEDLDSVFILDKSTNRILVTKKNGEYLAQYINPEFSKVSDFFVDEELKQIYLLIENKIYTTPLR